MNKRELVESIAGQVDASKQQVEAVLDRFMSTVGSTLKKGEKLALTGFGTFEARQRAARTGQNPQTGEPIKIKATVAPRFKPGQSLKDAVAGGGGGAKKAAPKKTAKKAAPKKTAKKAAPKKTAKKAAPKKTAKKAAPKKTAKKAAPKKTVKKTVKKTAKKG